MAALFASEGTDARGAERERTSWRTCCKEVESLIEPYRALWSLIEPHGALWSLVKNIFKNMVLKPYFLHGFKTLFFIGKLKARAENHMNK